MIGISKLYCGYIEASDVLRYNRYSKNLPSNLLQFSIDKKPIIVWNCTKRCNLNCIHCYSQSDNNKGSYELTTEEGKKLIDDISSFGCPVLLFSGGEPLLRHDIFELIEYAKNKNLRVVLSSNGTLLNQKNIKKLVNLSISYIGISLDGLEVTNDKFRGKKNSYKLAITGIQRCLDAGIKVGLRFTITKFNYLEIPDIFNLLVEKNIPRICFYHLVNYGRGLNIVDNLSLLETRETIDRIINHTKKLCENGIKKEILTVDNHCDGVYLYLKMKKENNPLQDEVLKLLLFNGGNSSGVGIACVNWDGEVYPDQFLRSISFGSIRNRSFSDIWTDISNPIVKKFKEKVKNISGRCSECMWLDICGGNFRARALALTGDLWASDPACYLTDDEIKQIHKTQF